MVLEAYAGGVMVTGDGAGAVVGGLRPLRRAGHRRSWRPGSPNASWRAASDPAGFDEEAFPLVDDQLDLGPLVRETLVLELPLAPLCRPESCADQPPAPTCGSDRNSQGAVRLCWRTTEVDSVGYALTCSAATSTPEWDRRSRGAGTRAILRRTPPGRFRLRDGSVTGSTRTAVRRRQ